MQTILGERKPSPAIRNGHMVLLDLKVVAIVTSGIDWAAYVSPGTASLADATSRGDKLPEAAARALFPGVEEPYRW